MAGRLTVTDGVTLRPPAPDRVAAREPLMMSIPDTVAFAEPVMTPPDRDALRPTPLTLMGPSAKSVTPAVNVPLTPPALATVTEVVPSMKWAMSKVPAPVPLKPAAVL